MKKFFALYVVTVLAVAVGTTSAKAGTIAHWTFEYDGGTDSAPATVTDSVQGLVGTTISGHTIVGNSQSGFGSKGLNLDGVNDTVQVSAGSCGPLALSGDFTIELGFHSVQNSGFSVIFGDPAPGQDPYYILVEANGNVLFQMYPGGGMGASHQLYSGVGAVALGENTHLAAVFDVDAGGLGDNVKSLYINQTLIGDLNIGTDTPFFGDTTSDFWIGSVHNAFGFMDGVLTDVRISDMALESSEMFPVPEPGMVAIFGPGIVGLCTLRRKRI